MKNEQLEINIMDNQNTRRDFVKRGTSAVLGSMVLSSFPNMVFPHSRGKQVLKLGLVGCGGRGVGALFEALDASPSARVVAIADVFADKTKAALSMLESNYKAQNDVTEETTFVGFDAFKSVLALCDAVILATPPPFRPIQFETAVGMDKHVFMEKPLAVDVPGYKKVMEAGRLAEEKKLTVVVGLQFRYDLGNKEMVSRIKNGELGEIQAISTYYNVGIPKVLSKRSGQTEMAYQMRNWRYFTWLWGGQLAGQAIHQIDMMNWVMDDFPVKALGNGGRLVYRGLDNGDAYDHFFIEFEYKSGIKMYSQSRNMNHCTNRMGWELRGLKGTANERRIFSDFNGKSFWRYRNRSDPSATQLEQNIFIESILKSNPVNNTEYGAKSTLTTIMGRKAAETGQEITMDELLQSEENLLPEELSWDSRSIKFPDTHGNYPIAKPSGIHNQ